MAEASKDPTDEELKEFAALETHAEKCAYFHEHPALAKIFRAIQFPKPAANPEPGET